MNNVSICIVLNISYHTLFLYFFDTWVRFTVYFKQNKNDKILFFLFDFKNNYIMHIYIVVPRILCQSKQLNFLHKAQNWICICKIWNKPFFVDFENKVLVQTWTSK